MDEATIWSRLTEIIRDILDDPEIVLDRDTTARDVEGWDSLTNIEIVVAVEQTFSVKFHTGEIAGLGTVGEFVDLIAARSRG